MLLRYAIPTGIIVLLTVCWAVDRSRLARELEILRGELDTRELAVQDKAELELFDLLEPGHAVCDHPNLRLLADDFIHPGHQHFDYCTAFLSEHFADVGIDFDDCEIVVYDVAVDAVPFHGGSYWIVIRNDVVVLAFPYMTIIGG